MDIVTQILTTKFIFICLREIQRVVINAFRLENVCSNKNMKKSDGIACARHALVMEERGEA